MCTEVNSAMGLQATAATKRKHEITFDTKDANTYTNCPPPLKASKWSMNNNNYIEAIAEKQQLNGDKTQAMNDNSSTSSSNPSKSLDDKSSTAESTTLRSICKTCMPECCIAAINSINKGKEVTKAAGNVTSSVAAGSSALTCSAGAELLSSTPLPPTLSAPVPEDSIAKLEVVAAVGCEPWTTAPNPAEPVDCISKLQAVAVPSDPWGSISTRSTLATTLLSAEELDDDDDDFEDDYEEEESIIPTYCPLRYHGFPPAPAATGVPLQPQRLSSYSPAHGYSPRGPNYYSEPFPQQNCSRTGSPQHMRIGSGNGFAQWQSGGAASNGGQQFYVPPETYPPQQQQTIRCAENGKSYLELGCSSPPPTVSNAASVPPPASPIFNQMHIAAANLDARHPLKRCCDGRGSWCNTNKNCYKDLRLKIRNLSMFKLSRFRQVSEQSLYRSVLICNTLKRIDREIEVEAKEMHQAAAHAAQQHHQQQQFHQHHHPHHLQHHAHHNHHQNQLPLPQPQPQLLSQQQPQSLLHPQQAHPDYSPVMNCARLANMDYQVQHLPLPQHHQPPQPHFQPQAPPPPPHYQSQPERMDTPPPPPYLSSHPQLQKAPANFALNCDSAASTVSSTLHPYDHYPFRESQSGRATPFPCQPVISTASPPASMPPAPQTATPLNGAVSTVSNAAIAAAPAPATVTATIANNASDSDSGYADDDSTRSINWSSVLSLSSQSALDPLNNNDLFSILPPATSVTSPATAVPVPAASTATSTSSTNEQSSSVAITGTFTTVQTANSSVASATSCSANSTAASSPPSPTSSTTATFTTLSTISSATHSLTSSYVSSMSSNAVSSPTSTWEYGFLDMDFGLGSEFTELVPSCKLSSDELFKSALTPVATSRYSSVHDNELEQPAHIMVGS